MIKVLRFSTVSLFLLLAGFAGFAQVNYTGLNGGLEGAATVDNATTYTVPQSGKFAKSAAAGTIASQTGTVRSGANALSVSVSSGSCRVWTPTTSVSSTTGQISIQYFRYNANTTNTTESQEGIYTASEALSGAYATSTAGTWTKSTIYARASSTYTNVAGVILARLKGTGGTMFVDDIAVYTGTADNSAPNSAGTVTVNNPTTSSLDVSWTAASGGVDGGGYLVVRYATSPNADNDPNTNGIYAVGNTTTNGTGSLVGTIRYVGTGTSFTDNSLASGTSYYYKVYTFDKAYNYAAESSGNGTTTSSLTTPTLTTPTATSITNDGATIGATISSDGGASISSRGTVWGTSAAPTGNGAAEGGTSVAAFSHARTGMGPNVQITYRGYAVNSQGTGYSPDGTFWTLANVPSAPTVNNPATGTLDVAVNVNSNPASTEFAIQETGSGNYVQAGGTLGASAVWQTAATWGTKTVTGLSVNTQYTFQVKARNGANTETAFSGTTALYTLANTPGTPTVNNATPSSLDVTIATNSNPAGTEFAIQETGGSLYVQADGSLGASPVWQTATTWGTKTVTPLTASTSYTFQVKARNGNNVETGFGGTATLSTTAAGAPDITLSGTLAAVNTTYGTASASPTSFDVSGVNISQVTGVTITPPAGFEVSLSSGSGYASTIDVGGTGSFGPTTVYVRLAATTNAGNYSGNITASSTGATNKTIATASSTVAPKALSITAASIAAKTYNNSATSGTVTPGTLSGFVGSETVVVNTAVGTYPDANAGTGKTASIAYTLADGTNGGLAANYTLANTSANGDINPIALSVTAPTIASKVYNGNTTAGAVTVGTLSGFFGTQTVTATGSAAAYPSANVGSYTGTVVTYTLFDGTNGGLAINYTLANGSATGAITAKALSVTAPSIASRPYDATTTAGAVTVGTLSGFVGSETVTATGSAANYSGANAGSYPGTVITYTLFDGTNGGLATNYSLANGSATGTVTAKALSITAASIAPKTYNGSATSGTVTPGTLSGFVGSETVVVNTAVGTYPDANAGTGKTATIVYTLGNGTNGGLAANYSLANTTANGDIDKANQTITFTGPLAGKTTASAPFAYTATASSGLTVTYQSSNTSVITMAGSTATVQGAGSSDITAQQAGNGNYNPATDVTLTQTVTLSPVTLAAWDFFGQSSPTFFAATTYNANLVTSGGTENRITRGSGAASSAGGNSFRTTGFQNNGISTANTDYFQVTVQAVSGKALSLSAIDGFVIGTSSYYNTTGASVQFAYSLDGSNFTLIGSPQTVIGNGVQTAIPSIDLTGVAALQNVANGTTITLRFYASGQTNTGGFGFSSTSSGTNGLAVSGYVVNPCTPPVSQASSVTATNITTTGVDAGYTRGASDGSVLAIRPTAISEVVPAQGSTYTGSTNWNTADQINASNRVLNNSTAAASSVVAVNGVSNLSPETQYTLTAYEYSTAGGTCYNTSSAPSATFYTYSLEPTSHAASFTTTACNISSLLLTFSAASTITNADGYVILFTSDGNAPSTSGVTDGVAPGSWTLTGTTAVLTTINSTATTTYNHTSLTPGGTYRYLLVPYNADASVNVGTYNYYIGGSPATATGVVGNASANSNLVEETSYQAGATNIAYGSYQAAPITTNSGCLPVFGLRLRDGGGAPDGDSKPTILTSITFSVNSVAQSAVRNYALFQGTTLIAQQVNPGTSTVTFSGLTLTAADNSNLDFALWASFNNTSGTITDNAQMSFSVSNAAVTSDCATNSSQFTTFTASSSTSGNINRLEVTATQIAFGTQPTDGVFNVDLAPFTVRFEDANNILDFDNNRTVTLTTTGANMSPATPSGSITAPHTGIITFSTVKYTTGPQDNITITANTTGLSTNSVQSNTFDISAVVYTTNDFRTVQAGTWSTQTNGTATFENWNGSGWVASSRPTATTHTIYVRHAITSNGSIQINKIIIENGGALTISSGGSTDYIEIQNGATLTKNGTFAVTSSVAKNFIIESGGLFVIKDNAENGQTATSNASTIWGGNEDFKPGSTVEIQKWGANNATTANRMVFNGTSISTNIYSGYTAAFGNLIINLTTGDLNGALVLISGGVTANLAHGNVTIKSGDNTNDVTLSSTGTVTSGIGGNFIVDANFSTSSPGSQVNLRSAAGSLTFGIKGSLLLNSATLRLGTGTGITSNITVDGDIALTNSAILEFSSNTSATNYHNIHLKGDLTVGASALLQNSNTSRRGFFNFAGTGDGLTAATTQTVDINSTTAASAANRNRYLSFNVNNGAYVQLINRNLQVGDSTSMTVLSGGVLDFGFTVATANNIAEVGTNANTAFVLSAGGKIKISSADGIDAGTALVGNVRLDNRTYNATGIYHYIGKTPSQRLGDGIPAASSGKYVIVELDALGTNLLFEGWNGAANVTTGNIVLNNAGNGLKIIQGTVTGTTTADFTGNANLEMTGGLYLINVPALTSIVPQLSGAYTITGGTVEINSTIAAQSLRGSRNYFNLTVSGAAPTAVSKSITDNIGVNGTLTFAASGGVLTTNAFKVSIGANGSVSGASQANGWVHGFLEKNVATGAGVLRDFEIGDNDDYTPVNLNFASVTAANNLTAYTVSADHPDISTSRIIPTKSVNRYWNITNGGVGFTTYSANFNFKSADLDVGVNTAKLFVAKYNTPNWSYPNSGARTATSTEITGVSSFSDFLIGEVDTFEWNGSVSTAWTNELNWSPNAVPTGCPEHVIIPAGTPFSPTISVADVSVGNVEIASGATLTLQGRDLNVCGNWYGGTSVTNASVLGTGTTFLNSVAGAQTVSGRTRFNILQINNTANVSLTSGANVSIGVGLHLQAGNFNVSAGTLRLLSTAYNHHSYIDNFSFGVSPGTLTGSILADRYVPVGGRNQHFISSPVKNPALSQIGASGPDGSYITPTVDCDEIQSQQGSAYGSVFLYDDGHRPNGACMLGNWMVKSSGNMETGRGYSAYLTGNAVLTLSGIPNTGDTVAAVKNSGYGTVNTKQLQPIESGWNLIGNPYPSAIDLTISRAGLGFSNQVQVWQTTGPFAGSWQPVVITGTPGVVVIPPFQGFMVLRTSPGNSSYPLYQSERTRNTNQPFYRRAADNSLTLELNYNGIKDVTTVEFNTDATNNFDDEYDANKPGAINRPTLYTHLNTNKWYSINTLNSIAQTSTVPVGLRPEVNGPMTITAQGLSTFDPTTYIFLEDKQTGGPWHNLRNGAYTFTSAKTDNQDRFVLHFTPAAEILVTDVSCSESGVISIQQPGSANWNYKLEDQHNVTIASGVLNASSGVGVNVVAGVYQLTLVDNNGYTVIKNIQVGGTQSIVASFTTSAVIAQTGELINFNATTTASLYNWDFGDGTGASTATANHQYQAEGTYMVKLTVTNAAGCQSTTTQTITITSRSTTGIGNQNDESGIRIWSSSNTVLIDLGKSVKADAEVELYNLIGQLISHEKFGRSSIYSKEIPNLDAAYLIVKVINDGKITTRRVFIGK